MPLENESIAEFIDRKAVDAPETFDVANAIKEEPLEKEYAELEHVRIGLDFYREWGIVEGFSLQPFGPQWSFHGIGRYPAPLETLINEVETWSRVGRHVADPLVRSRLCHLVWTSQHRDRYECAKVAIVSYMDLMSRASRPDVYRSMDLGYALDIAQRISDPVLIKNCIARGVQWLEESLESQEASPGAVLSMLEILTSLKSELRPTGLKESCERATKLFPDPFLLQSIFDIQMLLEPAQDREIIKRESVETWIKAADASEGLLKAAFLQRALEQARLHNLTSDIPRITTALQNLDLRGFMQEVSGSANVPREEFEKLLDKFIDFNTWQEALTAFGLHVPISETAEQARASAVSNPHQSIVDSISSITRVDDFGIPEIYIRSGEEHVSAKVVGQGRTEIYFWGAIAALVLQRLIEKWHPSREDIVEYFNCETIPETSRIGFALSLSHFANGDWESSMLVALPRIEESLRSLADYHGMPILDSHPNRLHKKNLGKNIKNLTRLGDELFFRYLDLLLANIDSINLCNRALHGLMGQATQHEAALAIHVACALRARPLDTLKGIDPS